MSTANNRDVSVCANCGKEGTDVNNTCNKCNMVKYCNASCKKKHRHKHRNDCEEIKDLQLRNITKNSKLPRSYMIKSCSNNLHHIMKIVPFVSYSYQHYPRGVSITHAVEKLFVVDVFMHLYMMIKATKLIITSAPFAELHILLQMRR